MNEKPIWWVEDDPDDEALIRLALEELGLADRVLFCSDGEKALERLRSAKEAPEVLFLDFKLPKMDAPEVIERLRADPRYAELPVVIFSSSRRVADAERCMTPHGANCFVSKPAEYEGFKLTVRQLLERWAPAAL